MVGPQTARNGVVAIGSAHHRSDVAWDHSLAGTNDDMSRFGMMPSRGGVRRKRPTVRSCFSVRPFATSPGKRSTPSWSTAPDIRERIMRPSGSSSRTDFQVKYGSGDGSDWNAATYFIRRVRHHRSARRQRRETYYDSRPSWRRECQSIPIERQSIFDLLRPKPTV